MKTDTCGRGLVHEMSNVVMPLTSKRKYRKSDTSKRSPDSEKNQAMGEEEFKMSDVEGNSAEEEVPSLAKIWKVLLQIKENTNHLNIEFEQLKTSFTLQDKQIPSLKEANAKLFKENTALKWRIEKVKVDIKTKDKQLAYISHQQDSLEQYTRKISLEFPGVPVMNKAVKT